MKIVHVVEAFAAGVLSVVVDLANSARKSGFDVTVVHGWRPDTPADATSLFHPEVKLVFLDMPQTISPWRDWEALSSLKRILAAENPDIVHAHSSKAGAIGRLAAWSLGIPVVYSPHGFSFLRTDVPPAKRKFYWLAEKALAGLTKSKVVGCSTSETELAKGLTPNVELIFNGIPVPALTRLKRKGKPLTFAAFGRLEPQKNPGLFAEVVDLVRQEIPSARAFWLGNGNQDLLKPVGSHKPVIEVTGWLPKDKALTFLQDEVDVLVNTSAWEGLPLSILEAMAMSLPVVATPCHGNLDAVVPHKSGFVASSAQDLAKAVVHLLRNPDLAQAMGIFGRKRVISLFSSKEMWQSFKRLYAAEIGKTSAGSAAP